MRGRGGLRDGGGARVGVARGRRGAGARRAGAADGGPVPPPAARRAAGPAARARRALHRAHARRRLVGTSSYYRIN